MMAEYAKRKDTCACGAPKRVVSMRCRACSVRASYRQAVANVKRAEARKNGQ